MKKFFAILLTAAILMCMSAGFALAEGYVYITGDTNVRTGPGFGYSKLATLNKGSTVDYLDQTRYDSRDVAWYRVSVGTGSAIGWVTSDYAYLTGTPGVATYGDGANAGGAEGGYWNGNRVTVTGNVNVRSGPGTNYEILNTMFKGDTAAYLGNTGYDDRGVMWYYISYGKTTGWVSSTYAKLENSYDAQSNWVDIVGGKANVRTGPGLSYKSVGIVYSGDRLDYAGSSSVDERGVTWYQVKFGDSTAWVSSTYAELVKETISWFNWVRIVGGRANVRTGAGLGYKSIGVAYEDETLSYLGQTSVDERGVVWYSVSFNGRNGWVSSTYAELE